MAINYYLPEAVRLQYSRAGSAVDAYTRGVQAQWRRSFEFFDLGYATGLIILFGTQGGQLVATDLQTAAGYNHNFATHGAFPASTLWLPSTLTPIDGSNQLVTTNIALYFDELGAGGTALTTFKCLARPEQIDPQLLQEGLAAAQVAYRWEIRDDAQPDITP